MVYLVAAGRIEVIVRPPLEAVEAQPFTSALRLQHAQGGTAIGPGLAVLHGEAEGCEIEAGHRGPL